MVEFQNKINCYLRPASDYPRFMRAVVIDTFATPDLKRLRAEGITI